MADFAAVNRIGNSQEKTNLVFFSESAASEMNTGGLYVAPEYADDLGSLADSKGIITGSYLLTKKEFNDNNSQLLANYLKSLQESTDYINAHLDEVAADVAKKFGVEEENFKADWQAQTLRVGFTEDGAEHLEEMADWAYTHGKYDKEFNVRDYIDTTAAKQYDPASVTIADK